ncbi:hypothetical protein WJX79_006125 [Trebouxia sp. C0005]
MTLLQVVGEPMRGEVAHTGATEFSGYVKRLPQVKPDEKLVMSQVLVPPLASEYNIVKDAWMDQKLWNDDNFIEVLSEDCPAKVKAKVVEAIYQYLDLHMDHHIKDLKRRQDHNWKRHLVESFETSLRDPPVSRNVEKYTVPNTDPIEALRGQLGLRTVDASDIFVVGVYRSRTMLELPTYTEQERVNTPPGFQKSPYWWGLELDRYAVDGKLFQPSWMAQGPVCEKPPSKKKRKESTAKGGTGGATVPKGQTSMWSAGYTMVHSAFGYGNETVLCNDPHALPYTSLDDTEAVEVAVKKSNISVKICRIGPWVFPVEVTTCFLPEGSPLLYFYGRDYWITNRASLALATLADTREDKLRRENEALQRRLHQMQRQHDQAAQLLSLQADPGVYLKHEASDMLTHRGPGSATCYRGVNYSARAVALTVPHDSAKSNVGTSQPKIQNQDGPGNPAAAGRLDNALSVNSGAPVGPAGDGPGLSGTALESVCAEVHDLRQSLGSMLQRMSALEFNLQDIKQTGDQPQLTKDQDCCHVEPLDSGPGEASDEHTQPVPSTDQGHQVEASLASKKRKSRALLSNWTAGQAGPEAAQQLTADPAHKKKSKKKKKSEAAAAPAVAPDPALAPKKKKQTVKVVGLAGSGLGAGFAEDADETVVEEESQQVGVTEGASNSRDALSCLNTTKTRFIVLEDGKINVNPDETEPRLVRRRIVGEDDEHGACYLIARDILKACGPIVSNTSRTIKRWIKRARKHSAADLPRRAYWSGASGCTFVFGPKDVQTLLLPGVLDHAQRGALQRFIEGMWADEEEGSPQADEEEASPGFSVKAAADRAVPRSPDDAHILQGGSDNIVGAGWGRAQAGEGPRGQLGVVSCGMQGQAVKTSFLQGPCGVCSAQESPRWCEGPISKPVLCNSCATGFMQGRLCKDHDTEAKEIKPSSGAATRKMDDIIDDYIQLVQQQSCAAPEAADEAVDAAACLTPAPGTSLSSGNKTVAGSGGRRSAHGHGDPSPLGGNPVFAEGKPLPPQNIPQGAHAAEFVTPAPHAAPATVSVSMCDAPMGGMIGNDEATTIGKRKKARKSTRTVFQPPTSVQHSTAAEADADVNPLDVKPINLDSSSGSAGARTAPPQDEVIDLT